MQILWLCNLMIDKIASAQGKEQSPYGGWLNGLCGMLARDENIELTVCYPNLKEESIAHGYADRLQYFGIPLQIDRYDSKVMLMCIDILKAVKPDAIHIFGTEYPHTLAMIQACEALALTHKTVVSIQGLVSVYPMHYFSGLPPALVHKQTMRDFILNTSIAKEQQKMLVCGEFEKNALSLAQHVAGRTEWDKACCAYAAPNAQYHFLGELLRETFYREQKWKYDACEPCSIFVSQSGYSVKGFHFALEALAMIKRSYPKVTLYTTGKTPPRKNRWIDRNKVSSYTAYVSELMKQYDLWDNVVFLGELNAEQIKAMYLKCNVFVCASSIENSSNSIAEAMMLGVPVVASCVGGVQSMLEHGVEGFLYQADAAYMLAWYVQRLFKDSMAADRMGGAAAKRAKRNHNMDEIRNQTITLYYELSKK